MNRDEKLHVIVAETSPIISSGIVYCLRRLPGFQIHTVEVHTYQDLVDCIKTSLPEIVIVNPSFGGQFDPNQLRSAITNHDFRLIGIEMSLMDKQVKALYDSTISIVEDIPSIAGKINNLMKHESFADDDKDVLSQREKEIVTLVVKGLTNKEIADKLFLSVHTVITHRRNIARKLEIHSATGLTIYAIVNQLVDLSEIKL